MSQREIAGIARIDESTMTRVELGTRKPPDELLEALPRISKFSENDVKLLLRSGNPENLRPELYLTGASGDELRQALAKKPVAETFNSRGRQFVSVLVGHFYVELGFEFPQDINGFHQEEIINITKWTTASGMRDIIRNRLQKKNQ